MEKSKITNFASGNEGFHSFAIVHVEDMNCRLDVTCNIQSCQNDTCENFQVWIGNGGRCQTGRGTWLKKRIKKKLKMKFKKKFFKVQKKIASKISNLGIARKRKIPDWWSRLEAEVGRTASVLTGIDGVVIMSSCHLVILSSCHLVIMSSCSPC